MTTLPGDQLPVTAAPLAAPDAPSVPLLAVPIRARVIGYSNLDPTHQECLVTLLLPGGVDRSGLKLGGEAEVCPL